MASRTLFLSSLPLVLKKAALKPALTIFVYDAVLADFIPGFAEFVAQFPLSFALESGEQLKSVESFASFCELVARSNIDLPAREMTVLAAGGGSLGDFAGFFASVYKRGVRLVHLPTTWLAAIDSAHGGKTALNVGGAKNQIGTFYPADFTCLVRECLESSDSEDAVGELAKIALIDGGAWTRKLASTRLHGADLLWTFLKPAIESKMRVVKRDPLEKSGVRQTLNLGHTMGHAAEALCGLSHGRAVAQGLFFALEYSHQKKLLKDASYEKAMSLMGVLGLAPSPARLAEKDLKKVLLADKKRSASGEVTFVFLKSPGRCERRAVKIDDVMREARRQGWT